MSNRKTLFTTAGLMIGVAFLVVPIFDVKADTQLKGTSLGEFSSGCDYYLVEDSVADYSLVEWYGGTSPDSGDIIYGDLHSYGFKDLYDASNDRTTHVWIDDWMLSQDSASEKLIDKCGWDKHILNYFSESYSGHYIPIGSSSYIIPPPPTISGCIIQSEVTGWQNLCEEARANDKTFCDQAKTATGWSGGNLPPICNQQTSSQSCSRAISCQQEVDKYNSDLQTYNNNITNSAKIEQDTSCQSLNGTFSHYDSGYKKCSCNKGYTLADGQCEAPAIMCQNLIGINSYPSGAVDVYGNTVYNCICSAGYTKNSAGICEALPPPPHVLLSTRSITKRAFDKANQPGDCNNSILSSDEISECDDYRYHYGDYNWQVSDQSVISNNSPVISQQPQPATQQNNTSSTAITKQNVELKKPAGKSPFIKTGVIATSTVNTKLMPKVIGTASSSILVTKQQASQNNAPNFLTRFINYFKFW